MKGNLLQTRTLVRGSGIPSMSGKNLGTISIKYFDVFAMKIYRKGLLGFTHGIKQLLPRSIAAPTIGEKKINSTTFKRT